MKQSILFALLLVHTSLLCQNKVCVKLIDSYNYQTIQLNNSFVISNKKHTIDTINDLITILKPRGHKLKFTSSSHDPEEEKVKLKRFKNDTISVRLTPNESTIAITFHQIWENKNPSTDTLHFNTSTDFEKHLKSNLSYLSFLSKPCIYNNDCGNAMIYKYEIEITENNSVFQISKITETNQNRGGCCLDLQKYVETLITIYPKFTLADKIKPRTLSLIIRLM